MRGCDCSFLVLLGGGRGSLNGGSTMRVCDCSFLVLLGGRGSLNGG